MARFHWDLPPPVGVIQLDEQHLHMHHLLSDLIRRIEEDPRDPETEASFRQLSEKIMEHFMTEEDHLEAEGYPGLTAHRYEHELLFERFWEKMVRWHAPEAPPLVELMKGVAGLIQEHFDTVDRQYAEWLRNR